MATIKYKAQPAIPVVLVNDPDINDGTLDVNVINNTLDVNVNDTTPIDVNIASSDITIGGGSVATTQYIKAYDITETNHLLEVDINIDGNDLTGSNEYNVTIDFDPYLTVLTFNTIAEASESISHIVYDFGNGFIQKSELTLNVIHDFALMPDGEFSINIYVFGVSGVYVVYNILLEKLNGYISKITHNNPTAPQFDYTRLNSVIYLPIEDGIIGNPIDENGDTYTVDGTISFTYEKQNPPIYSTSKSYTPTTECNTLSNGIQYPLLTALDECTLDAVEAIITEKLYTPFRQVLTGDAQTFTLPVNCNFVSVYPVVVGNTSDRPTITDLNATITGLYQGVEERYETNGLFTSSSIVVNTNHANDVVVIKYTVVD